MRLIPLRCPGRLARSGTGLVPSGASAGWTWPRRVVRRAGAGGAAGDDSSQPIRCPATLTAALGECTREGGYVGRHGVCRLGSRSGGGRAWGPAVRTTLMCQGFAGRCGTARRSDDGRGLEHDHVVVDFRYNLHERAAASARVARHPHRRSGIDLRSAPTVGVAGDVPMRALRGAAATRPCPGRTSGPR